MVVEHRSVRPRVGRGTIVINAEFCKGCEICVAVCPEPGVLAMSDRVNSAGYRVPALMNEDGCTGCSFCARMCPDIAIAVFLKDTTRRGRHSGTAEEA